MIERQFNREDLKDISDYLRSLARAYEYRSASFTIEGQSLVYKLGEIAERIDAATKRDAQRIERAVRDAIIDYQEMYANAPNDECEREIKERALNANKWLKDHGFDEEKVVFDKEEVPCC